MANIPLTMGLVSTDKPKKKSRAMPKEREGDYNVTDPFTKTVHWFYSIADARAYCYHVIINNPGYRYHYERRINIRNKRSLVGQMHMTQWGPVFYDPKNDKYTTSIGHLVSPTGHLRD